MAQMGNTAAVLEVQAGLVAALRADATLRTLLHLRPAGQVVKPAGRVYDEGTVPDDLVGRWVVIGTPTEGWARAFMGPGSRLTFTVHTWHAPVPGDDVGKAVSMQLWAQLAQLLSRPITIAGHRYLAGTGTLIEIVKDPDGPWHGVITYEARTQVAP